MRRFVLGLFALIGIVVALVIVGAGVAVWRIAASKHVVVIGVGGLFLFCMGVLFFFFLSTLVRWSGLAGCAMKPITSPRNIITHNSSHPRSPGRS